MMSSKIFNNLYISSPKTVIFIANRSLTQLEFNTLLTLVSTEKQKRIQQFRSFLDAQNCLIGDILVRMEICLVTGFSNKQLKFSVNEYGKPCLINVPDIYYNISHTGLYIACVLSDEPVGIDIESIKPIDLKIAERLFARDEIEYIISPNDNLVTQRFFEIWTKRESIMKREGRGLSKTMRELSVIKQNKMDNVIFHEVFRNEEVICYVCSTTQEAPTISIMNTDLFIKKIMILFN